MADTVEVGRLVVRLIADAKQLETALSKGSADFRKFGDDADKASKKAAVSADRMATSITNAVRRIAGLAAAFVSVNAVVSAFNNSVANTTALDHLSQVTGISIQRLNELRGIAVQLGIDFNVISQAASQFGARMTEALASSTSRGSQAIRALGIDVRDAAGNIRQLDELLPELADRFSQFADGSNKAAIAAALFGEEAGPRLIPLLNRGRAGIEELRRAIGSTITPQDIERVREYQRVTGQAQLAFEGLGRELVNLFGPGLTIMAQALADALRNFNQTNPAIRAHAEAVAHAQREYEVARERLDFLNRQLDELEQRHNRGGLSVEAFRRAQQNLTDQIERQILSVRAAERIWNELLRRQGLASGPIKADPNAPGNRLPAPQMDPHALERAQLALDRIMERLSGQRDLFDSINFSWQEHANVVQQAIDAIGRAHETQHRREHALHQLNMMMRKQEQQAMLSTASQAASTIQALWPKQKGAAIAAAVINTAVGITRALAELPPPWSWAQAALIAASGAAQISQIRSTNETGSSGGTATPAPADSTPGRALMVQGVDPAHMFSGGQVRGLIELINDEVRNGATLISTGNLGA